MSGASDFKDTLKQQADIVRIVGDYVKLKKAGAQNYSGLCPFHSEKTPSFSVHATRQFYHCFGCGASGDVFSFVQKVENITFPEAIRVIAQKLGVPLPKITYSSPQEAAEARQRTALLEMQERACAFFQQQLASSEGARAREYLSGRGLSAETISGFRIGYAPDSGFLLRDVLRRDYDEELLKASGLLSWKEQGTDGQASNDQSREPRPQSLYSKFRNRVMFPIANENGKIIAFTGRTLATDDKSGPKYLNSPETGIYSKSKVLFNLDQAKEWIRKFDYAILVEGQMDCISVFAAGFQNVIASSGTAFTEMQARLLGRYSKNVAVNFDPDTAGARATERTLGLLVEEDFQIKVVTLEPGLDPDLFIRRKGKPAYEAALRQAQRYFDYLIERARSQFPVRSAEGKVKAVNHLLPHIQRVPSRIVRDELAQEIAQKLSIDSRVLRQELKHAAGSRSAAALKAPVEAQVTDAERILIRALAASTEMQEDEEPVSSREGVDDEFDPARQAEFVLRNERLHEGMATESLIEALLEAGPEHREPMELPLSEGDRRLLAALLLRDAEQLTPLVLEGAVGALRAIHVQRRLDQVLRDLQGAAAQDPARLRELLREMEELKSRLKTAG
jgi:DNA primase